MFDEKYIDLSNFITTIYINSNDGQGSLYITISLNKTTYTFINNMKSTY